MVHSNKFQPSLSHFFLFIFLLLPWWPIHKILKNICTPINLCTCVPIWSCSCDNHEGSKDHPIPSPFYSPSNKIIPFLHYSYSLSLAFAQYNDLACISLSYSSILSPINNTHWPYSPLVSILIYYKCYAIQSWYVFITTMCYLVNYHFSLVTTWPYSCNSLVLCDHLE